MNLNYQRVPELEKKGMEYIVSASQRVDLVLREAITGRPVIVEFKAVPFHRENIGQIFEYEKPMRELVKPKVRRSLEDVTESLNRSVLPATDDRIEYIERLDEEIKDLMSEMNMEHGYKKYRFSYNVYPYGLENFFINRWYFQDSGYEVSFGFYEDIFESSFNGVAFLYYAGNQVNAATFRAELVRYRKDAKRVPAITVYQEGQQPEYELRFAISKKGLIEDPRAALRPWLTEYAAVMKKVFVTDVRES